MKRIKFRIKHIKNLLIRVFTHDNYYVCEECHKIHKRDGKECRLDNDKKHLILHYLWYGSVCRNCYCNTIQAAMNLLRGSKIRK